ncbi:WW domain [Phytophthora cinnamomi]|uniref:WW domain n=1 Tax=Phytophthora cinnamomi TaxID=4785 RepID=UPI0035594876|nr:WW domain [Phytophthora cinnamomi]
MDAQHQTPRLASPPHVPRSPLKIQPEEFVDTPSSSATTSPAESCASDVVKQPKPWERTASMASSVDSSETSGPVWEEDDDDDQEEPEGSIVVENSAKRLMREAALQEKQQPQQQQHRRARAQSAETSSSCLSPVEETSEVESEPDLQKHAAWTATNNEPSELVLLSPVGLVEVAPFRNGRRRSSGDDEVHALADQRQGSSASSSDEEGPPAIKSLLSQVKSLQEQLKTATDENLQLKHTVDRLEEENARLQAQTAFTPTMSGSGPAGSARGQESKCVEGAEAGDSHDGEFSRLTNAIFGNPSAFQMVMEEDLAVLKNHERCQHKLHELWDTVRTLKTFVETYEIERNVMRAQRDEAIADAERADAENVKLASSSNPQQKIKYLQQVKKDNQELRRKNRALNVRIAQQAAKAIHEKNGCSVLESATLDDTLEDGDDLSAMRSGEEVLRSMRDRSGVLEQRLERLRLARQQVNDCSEEASGSESELPARSSEVPLAATIPRPVTSPSMSSSRMQDLHLT